MSSLLFFLFFLILCSTVNLVLIVWAIKSIWFKSTNIISNILCNVTYNHYFQNFIFIIVIYSQRSKMNEFFILFDQSELGHRRMSDPNMSRNYQFYGGGLQRHKSRSENENVDKTGLSSSNEVTAKNLEEGELLCWWCWLWWWWWWNILLNWHYQSINY